MKTPPSDPQGGRDRSYDLTDARADTEYRPHVMLTAGLDELRVRVVPTPALAVFLSCSHVALIRAEQDVRLRST